MMTIRFTVSLITVLVAVAIAVFVAVGGWAGMEYYTSQSSFCGGSCHIMEEQYKAWKADTHYAANNPDGKQAECVECHFLPGEKMGFKAKMEGLRHLSAYLYDPDAPLPIRPVVKDGSCLQSGCHAQGKFRDKELLFSKKKVKFKHNVHLGDKALEGQKLTCDTCHFKTTAEKHFEVPSEICFLCHLKLEKHLLEKAAVEQVESEKGAFQKVSFSQRPTIDFNQGISKCSVCHEIPTKSLQSQIRKGDLTKPITHQSMQKAGVACEGCHFEVVAGAGEIETGNVVSNGCLTCHNRSKELLSKAGDKKLMHDEHIAKPRADCFDCHTEIEHKNRTDHLDFVRRDCQLCHQSPHMYQKILLAGITVTPTVRSAPHLMFSVNTNCMACHLKKKKARGHSVRTGAPETCVSCHTPAHEKMLTDWRVTVEREIKGVEEVEAEALQALSRAKGKADAATFAKAKALIVMGQDLLDIVRIGNGVHNKKYTITIIDEVYPNFEDAIDLLGDGQ